MFEDYGGAEGEGELGEGTFKRASRSGRDSRRSWKVQGAGQCHTMSDLEGLMSQLREEAAVRGAEWLQETISAAIRAPSAPASEGERGSHRARRSRPPERFSPDRVTNSQRHPGNMVPNVQGGPPAKRSAGRERVSGRAAPTGQERIPAGGRTGDRPNSGRRAGSASPAPRKTAVSSAIAANATPAVVPGPSSTSAGDRQDRGRNRTGLLPTRAEAGRTAVAHTGPGKAVRKSTGGFAARRKERMAGSAAAAVNVPGGPVSDAEEDAGRSEGEEMSGSEEETAQLHRRMGPGESRRSADGATPMQPGELTHDTANASLNNATVSGAGVGSSVESRVGTDKGGGAPGFLGFLTGIKELVQRLEAAEKPAGGPIAAWVPQTEKELDNAGRGAIPTVAADVAVPAQEAVASVAAQGKDKAAQSGEAAAGKDIVRLADAARCEVYVCYEGPLGAHLKQEVREKLWKGEYVEIFSLLPLEKFNLDRVKPDDSKKEDEEKRRYRLIPRTFTNWLQAFAIMASVIGEKQPEHCSALFCYQDAIGEAYRVYGGTAWLRYDEQFRQRRAVRPELRWDHKDISLWMRLLTTARAPNPFFQGGAGGPSTQGHAAGNKKGVCWQYNSGVCRFGGSCKFKHECSGCGGTHPSSRCFKQGKGRQGEAGNKREDSGDGGKDATVSR